MKFCQFCQENNATAMYSTVCSHVSSIDKYKKPSQYLSKENINLKKGFVQSNPRKRHLSQDYSTNDL